MKKQLFFLVVLYIPFVSFSQYEPGAVNYGLVAIKGIGSVYEIGAGARIEYAPNCYTTYMAEYNRLFSINATEEKEGYNEVAVGVNLILFNWYPTTITAGFGYLGNDSSAFKEVENDALLGFRTGNFNHGIQIKIRALYQLSIPVHIFAELNIKSLGRQYDAFLIGFSYDFQAR